MFDHPSIEIKVFGRWAVTATEFAPQLCPVLEYRVRRFAKGGPVGYRQQESMITYWHVRNDQLIFCAGHLQRVEQHLQRNGYSVRVCDHNERGHLDRTDRNVLVHEAGNPARRDALRALTRQRHGQLHVASPDEVPHTIALMGRLFPRENILVVAKNRTAVNWLAAEVGARMNRPVDRDFGIAKHRRPRFLVVTSQLGSLIGGDDFNVVVYADLESALHQGNDPLPRLAELQTNTDERTSLPGRWPKAAMYLVCDAHRSPTATEEFRIEALFGPVIFSVFNTPPRRDIVFTFVPFNGHKPGQGVCALDRKRRRFWHNEDWNSRVAEFAQQVAAGAISVLPTAEVTLLPHPWISILVESEEHAAELQRRLPGWTLRSLRSPMAPPRVLEPRVRQIVTQQFAAQHGFGSDIIIRADGGDGWPLAGILEKAPQTPCSRVVVDLEDRRDRECLALTESRRRAYAAAGWWARDITDDSTGSRTQNSGMQILDTVSAL